MRKGLISLGLATCLTLGALSTAHAQADFVGVRALGMGEALRANATGASGPLLNPAGMSLNRQYSIDAMYGFQVETLGHNVNVSVVDSVTSKLAAALFYNFIYTNPQVGFDWAGGHINSEALTRTGHVAGLSLSVPLGDKFIIGATAKYLDINTTAPLPSGTVPPNLTLDGVNGVTFDVALLLRLAEKFHITAIGYNLWDHGSRETPLSLGLAISVIPIPTLNINFDTVLNFTGFKDLHVDPASGRTTLDSRTTARLGPGIEWVVADKVPLRFGVVYDSGFPATFITGGLGYASPKFGADLSYRAKVQGGVENFLMLGLRVFVD